MFRNSLQKGEKIPQNIAVSLWYINCREKKENGLCAPIYPHQRGFLWVYGGRENVDRLLILLLAVIIKNNSTGRNIPEQRCLPREERGLMRGKD